MSIICKASVAGIFAAITWLGITGAAWADFMGALAIVK
jgi:hypothetical protein